MSKECYNSIISQNYLSKSKKYYKKQKNIEDKENQVNKNISSILSKLPNHSLPQLLRPMKKQKIQFSNRFQNKSNINKLALLNSCNFFEKEEKCSMERKDLQKEILYYIKRLKQPVKTKCSLYQEYLSLCQETNDYLEYYLINYAGEEHGKASQLLKQQGKTVILLVVKKKYRCFQQQQNPPDILHRIMLAFNLNPFNDFQFISWDKFMKIRKLISGQFNRRDCTDFIITYFFSGSNKIVLGSDFWSIFNSVIRKIGSLLDQNALDFLLNRITDIGKTMIVEDSQLTKQKLRNIIFENSQFIWHQFVILAFI